MKKELIKTENYLLVVDDSEIQYDDHYVTWDNNYNPPKYEVYVLVSGVNGENPKKIIAYLPLNDSPILEGVDLLPPLEEEDKELYYQKQVMQPYSVESQSYTSYENGFIDGYNKAKEKYKYTEEDMIIIRNQLVTILPTRDISAWWDMIQSISKYTKWLDEYVESLSQPKMPTHFEFETIDDFTKNNGEYIDELGAKGNYYTHSKIIKTTTNSQGQKVACGKYIY